MVSQTERELLKPRMWAESNRVATKFSSCLVFVGSDSWLTSPLQGSCLPANGVRVGSRKGPR